MCRGIGLKDRFREAKMSQKRQGIIVSASSDIGLELSRHFLRKEFSLVGTFRTASSQLRELENQFLALIQADFADSTSVDECIGKIKDSKFAWDFVILCPGTMEPIGRFESCNIDDWEINIKINLLNQLRFVHGILPLKHSQPSFIPTIVFFAGGGTNSAPVNFSAYTLSKIALIKAVELLDAEHDDVCFTILGPGWVKTKIHSETLRAGEASGEACRETNRRFGSGEFTPMSQVTDCCDWLIHSDKCVVGGRNFSVVYDPWAQDDLAKVLRENPDMYKLRRYGNDWFK